MRLHQAIDHWKATEAMNARIEKAGLTQADSTLAALVIPLKQTGKAAPLYTSPIAYRLAAHPDHAATVATQIVNILLQSPDGLEALPAGITVQAIAGLIHFKVGDRAIAAWLDQLLANALLLRSLAHTVETEQWNLLPSAAIFDAQYAHARCCSLLWLAHDEKLIRLERLEEPPFYWRFNVPKLLPWFRAAHFALDHRADRCLILRLFEAFDCVSAPSSQQTPIASLRSAQAVAQAFQVFHRTHPLWQRTEYEPASVVAQLGLLMATQRILYLLLAEGLHLSPVVGF